jgi:signal peptidase I
MAKKNATDKPAQEEGPGRDKPAEKPVKHKESWRDTIESIVFAFVLAFLFRTFEAEAFVIPTGSMAPTLRGRHKECDCEMCGYRIVVGASDEVDNDTGYLYGTVDKLGHHDGGVRLLTAICPNCRHENTSLKPELAFNGDRILVNKYPYEFGDPDRFDVFVFKWPENPETNYIKRLVGLPHETIRIRQGDLFLWKEDDDPSERILRKDRPEKQRRLQIPVYDDHYPPRTLIQAGWPERWRGMAWKPGTGKLADWSDDPAGWALEDDGDERTYYLAATQDLSWLRYRHFVPLPSDWDDLADGNRLQSRAQLVSDFCGYNAYTTTSVRAVDYGPFWVGDLTVNCRLELEGPADDAEIVLELVEGVYRYRCRINPATGAATLVEANAAHGGGERSIGSAQTGLVGAGSYDISFANVDDRLCLWIDDELIDFGEAAAYHRSALANSLPTTADLTPVGIAVRGVTARASRLLLERDIYYRADTRSWDQSRFQEELTGLLTDPEEWAQRYLRNWENDQLDLVIPADHFLALGDNSPRSSDSRMWNEGNQTVPREYLVGKAFFIYWPHGVPFLNGGQGYQVWPNRVTDPANGRSTVSDYPRYTAPFYPQISRMHRIR